MIGSPRRARSSCSSPRAISTQETSRDFANVLKEADGAVRLTEDAAELTPQWNAALARVSRDENAARLVMGAAARLLYEADAMTAEEATVLLGRALSPGTDVADGAAYFEGFLRRVRPAIAV